MVGQVPKQGWLQALQSWGLKNSGILDTYVMRQLS